MGTTGAVTFRFAEEKLFGLVAELELDPTRMERRLRGVTIAVFAHIDLYQYADYDTDNLWLTPLQVFYKPGTGGWLYDIKFHLGKL